MIKTLSDLEIFEGRVTSTPEELLQYMVNGFTDDVIYYNKVSMETAKRYRSEMIKELSKGVIPNSLYMNLSLYKIGVIVPRKESTSNRVTRRKA